LTPLGISLSFAQKNEKNRRLHMIALTIGIVLILFAVYSILPVSWGLQWWTEVIQFLKGGVPILAVFVGLIAFFVGIADIKDKREAKKEEEEEKAEKKGADEKK
jgi:hypothetical protein